MKNIVFGLLALVGFSATLSSCQDKSRMPAPAFKSMPVIFPVLTPGKNFINFDSVRAANVPRRRRQEFEFKFSPTEQRDLKLEAVEVYKSYSRVIGTAPVLGPRVLVGTYRTFPVTIKLAYPELLAGLQRYNGETLNPVIPVANPDGINNLIAIGDAVVFTFEYIAEGGQRIILTPLNAVGAPTGTFTNAAYTATAVIRRAQ
ncbi:hypothetical protein GCM10023185_01110 [Hymenobacter saemangeumensis]|uniref:DUF4397 domain-containing protein n=1 Tax=Hymenobacter saemangeumensis TaxID=1084522 RepID=A0ABP8HX76_9BACT